MTNQGEFIQFIKVSLCDLLALVFVVYKCEVKRFIKVSFFIYIKVRHGFQNSFCTRFAIKKKKNLVYSVNFRLL